MKDHDSDSHNAFPSAAEISGKAEGHDDDAQLARQSAHAYSAAFKSADRCELLTTVIADSESGPDFVESEAREAYAAAARTMYWLEHILAHLAESGGSSS